MGIEYINMKKNKNMKRTPFIILCVIVAAVSYGLYWWKYTYLHDKLFRTAELHKVQSISHSTHATKKPTKEKVVPNINLLKDGQFENKFKDWQLWHSAKTFSNTIKFINVPFKNFKNAVRIENSIKKLVGVQQRVMVNSNTIYRLSGFARSTVTNNPKILFGGRIAFWQKGQKEKQIVWMSEYNKWWKKEFIFTNRVAGIATVYVHMGYGNVASTGEFADIKLEMIDDGRRKTMITNDVKIFNESLTQIVCLVKSKTNIFYKSVWKALQNAEDNNVVHIADGDYYEKQCNMMIPLASGLTNLQIIGYGQPIINVNTTNVSYCNEVALNIPNNVNLYISNIVLKSTLNAFNTHRSYNINLNGCKNALIESSVFESVIYGTNNNFKNFIATDAATNILVKNSLIITTDITGSNYVWQAATHDAQPTKFVDCTFISTNIKYICIGKSIFSNCFGNVVNFKDGKDLKPLK